MVESWALGSLLLLTAVQALLRIDHGFLPQHRSQGGGEGQQALCAARRYNYLHIVLLLLSLPLHVL